MKKKWFILWIALLASIALINVDVQAYSSFYYNNQNIRVGLKNISGTTLSITVNGYFTLDNTAIKNGTKYNLSLSNGQIKADDGLSSLYYEQMTFIPGDSESYISVTFVKDGKVITQGYKGTMSFKIDGTTILPINTLNIEEYLKGVVGYEMSNYYPIEALKAQAIIARTYAAMKISLIKQYDVVDTIVNQVYNGSINSHFNVHKAVEATKGQFVTYKGNLVKEALYSATNGGYTEDAVNVWGNTIAYLKAKKDDFDDPIKYENSASYNRIINITKAFIANKLGTTDVSSVNINLDTITTYESGRISNLSIEYKNSYGLQQIPKILKDDSARTFFGVRSAMYTVSLSNIGEYIFSTKGYGHGLGMSQIGAMNRAYAGQTYNQIIEFYYDGAVVTDYKAHLGDITLSSSEVLTGENITINSQGLNGSGNYIYKYEIEKDGVLVDTRDYQSGGSLVLKPDNVGTYKVNVFFKDQLSEEDYEETKSISFNVTGLADVNLDKKVDIYDLVIISKNLEKSKVSYQSWNPKLDLVKDDQINILDLAKAAQVYNIKY